jgi:hypothetical protein
MGNGLADPLGRPDIIPLLVGDDAQEVQGIGVVRLSVQDLTIETGGLVKKTTSMLFECLRQDSRHEKLPS